MSLALNEPHRIGCSSFKFLLYFQACTVTSKNNLLILHAKQPIGNRKGPTPDGKSNDLKENSSAFLFVKMSFEVK